MTRKFILGIILAAAMGFVMAAAGITLVMWQWWVVMALYCANDLNERF